MWVVGEVAAGVKSVEPQTYSLGEGEGEGIFQEGLKTQQSGARQEHKLPLLSFQPAGSDRIYSPQRGGVVLKTLLANCR